MWVGCDTDTSLNVSISTHFLHQNALLPKRAAVRIVMKRCCQGLQLLRITNNKYAIYPSVPVVAQCQSSYDAHVFQNDDPAKTVDAAR